MLLLRKKGNNVTSSRFSPPSFFRATSHEPRFPAPRFALKLTPAPFYFPTSLSACLHSHVFGGHPSSVNACPNLVSFAKYLRKFPVKIHANRFCNKQDEEDSENHVQKQFSPCRAGKVADLKIRHKECLPKK